MNKPSDRPLLRLLVFILIVIYWVWLAGQVYGDVALVLCVLGPVALCYPILWLGRRALDAEPTQAHTRQVTAWVHLGLMICLGTAIVVAAVTAERWQGWAIPLDPSISFALMLITSFFTFLTVINLALRGLGAPFAVTLTRRVATDWLYKWTRNPMVLGTLAFMVTLGLWYQSALFVLWVLLWLTPAWIAFLKVYEERELEIRLGQPYLDYKARTPFIWPRRPAEDS